VKHRIVAALVLSALIVAPVTADANPAEIQELKNMIVELQAAQAAQIAKLQAQIDELSRTKEIDMARLEDKVDQKLIDAEYVGRYEGPFKKGGLVVREHSGHGNVSVGGYMDHEFENFQNTHSTFDQHRWILNVGAELNDRLRFYSEYEIEHGGPNAQGGGGQAKVEQAWLDYKIIEQFNVRGGALLVPFGRYNLYHDSDLQDLTDRPIVSRDIIPTTWTESGAGFWGEFADAFNVENLNIGYETYVVNGLDSGFSDTGMGGGRSSLDTDNNNNKGLVGRVVVSPALGHEVGVSGYHGKYNNLNDDITGVGVDWLTTWGPLEFLGEYARFNVDEPVGGDVANTFEGFYVQLNYHFWPAFFDNTFLKTGFDDPTFTLVGRFDWAEIEDDGDASFGNNQEDRWTLGLNYRPVPSWVFKAEYQWNQTENESLERGSNDGAIVSAAMGF
jgi:phosphate-selective porin